jgi:sec-independent protein translocase protein TatC
VARIRSARHDEHLTLVEHLDELRTRIIISAMAFLVAFGLCFWQNHELLKLLNDPLPDDRHPITLGVTEPFMTTFTVAGYAALLVALPFLLWQAYAFVLPAFSPSERKVALPLMFMVPALFLAGVAFGYFVALPRAIHFLLTFNDGNFDILIRATDYYKFAIVLIALIGLLFQIPVGVLAVTRLGIISARQLARNRGYVILAIAVVAAVATPTPDPVTMLIAMAPLLVLFELSVLLARIFERRRLAAEPDERWDLDDDLSLS